VTVPDARGQTPSELVTRYEGVLRELIRSTLGTEWHDGTGIDLDKLREKRDYERGRRRGVVVPEDLLAFTEHLTLVKIINHHWSKFAGALGDKKRWTVYSDRIAAIRNAPMHGRELLHFERDLLAGMTGEIGNVVAQHRSAQGPDSAWYPVIESISDSFGNDVTAGAHRTGTRLSVGETVRFRCVGRDPQDRPLSWKLSIFRVGSGGVVDSATGSEVSLSWTVGTRDVSERCEMVIELRSDGEYHRLGELDVMVFVGYAVNPPS
jgi:hypothetical protein